MRAICKVCKDKDTCSYIKQGREGDCIDVQTSDYGYDEAVKKAVKWFEKHMFNEKPDLVFRTNVWENVDHLIRDFEEAMEEERWNTKI